MPGIVDGFQEFFVSDHSAYVFGRAGVGRGQSIAAPTDGIADALLI
jgi:hypothetical protein